MRCMPPVRRHGVFSSVLCVHLLLLRTTRASWGAWTEPIFECEYDLDQAACELCQGPWHGAAPLPVSPNCIHTLTGCCSSAPPPSAKGDRRRWEYFLKESLERYHGGGVVSYFFPHDDLIMWVAGGQGSLTPEPGNLIPAPGRCAWSVNYEVPSSFPSSIHTHAHTYPTFTLACTHAHSPTQNKIV